MGRYVIDAPTLLYLVDHGLGVHPAHQLVAPSSIRSEALELLLAEVRRGDRPEKAALETHERMTEMKMRLLGDRVSRRRGRSRGSRTGTRCGTRSTSPSPVCKPMRW